MPTITSPDMTAKAKRFLPPPALAIYRTHEVQHQAAADANYARYLRRESEKPELQNLYTQLAAEQSSPKPNASRVKELGSEIADTRKRWTDEDAEHEARQKDYMNLATPSAWRILETWMRLDLKSRQQSFGFTEQLPEGKSPRDMVDECREASKASVGERRVILNAPQTTDEIAAVIGEAVRDIARKTNLDFSRVRKLDFNADKNRFEQRQFKLPTRMIFDGVGTGLTIPDAFGLMALLFPEEMTDRLTALAVNGERNNPNAMNRGDREAAFDNVEAKILANARRGEFWIRQCQARNIAGGPRFTEDPRAILDLV